MSEKAPYQEPTEETIEGDSLRDTEVEKLLTHAVEMTRHEVYPFISIKQEAFDKIHAEDEEFPGFTTPIKVLRERMIKEGMKISLGAHPKSGNIFVLPGNSDDIENDSIPLKHIELNATLIEKVEEIRSLVKAINDLEEIDSKK